MKISELLKTFRSLPADQVFYFIDAKVYELYHKKLKLPEGTTLILPAGEKCKSIKYYNLFTSKILKMGVTRRSHLVAIGGGATSDLVGFIAATALRGMSWSVVPTTLLSMVDASIGGKVGINLPLGKNLIGATHFPQAIYIAPEFLKTLSKEERASGLGEILKYTFLSRKIYLMVKRGTPLDSLILECQKFKNEIVQRDPYESGIRLILNLGHTIGHAIEKKENLPHGLAVIVGIKMILQMYNTRLLKDFDLMCEKLNIPQKRIKCPTQSLVHYISMDKKRLTGNQLQIIVPQKMGEVEIKTVSLASFLELLI